MNLFGVLSEVYPTLLTGLTMTVKITILSLIIALVIGIFVFPVILYYVESQSFIFG